jgi:hypothetical protein
MEPEIHSCSHPVVIDYSSGQRCLACGIVICDHPGKLRLASGWQLCPACGAISGTVYD